MLATWDYSLCITNWRMYIDQRFRRDILAGQGPSPAVASNHQFCRLSRGMTGMSFPKLRCSFPEILRSRDLKEIERVYQKHTGIIKPRKPSAIWGSAIPHLVLMHWCTETELTRNHTSCRRASCVIPWETNSISCTQGHEAGVLSIRLLEKIELF